MIPRRRPVTLDDLFGAVHVISRRATGPMRSVVSGASGTDVGDGSTPQFRDRSRAVTVAWPAMPRSFDMAAEYEGSVEQVHRAFSDEQYWLARLTDSGADDYSLDSRSQ